MPVVYFVFFKGGLPCQDRNRKASLFRLAHSLWSSWPSCKYLSLPSPRVVSSVPPSCCLGMTGISRPKAEGVDLQDSYPQPDFIGSPRPCREAISNCCISNSGDKPGARWLSPALSKAGLLPMSLFSCLSSLSVKFLGLLLLLWKQTSSFLPTKPGDVGLETMPGDTGPMLLRNHCRTVPKAQPFSGNEPRHQVSYWQRHQASCRQRAPPSHQPWYHLCNFPGLWSIPRALAGHGAGKAER